MTYTDPNNKRVEMRFFMGHQKELEATTDLQQPLVNLTIKPGILFKVCLVSLMEDVEYYIDKVLRERRPPEPYFVQFVLVSGDKRVYTTNVEEVRRFLEVY